MAFIDLFGTEFFDEIEKDVLSSVGVSLVRNKKVVTARTIKSVRAVTVYNSNSVEFSAFGGEGLPFIMTDKPAGTKLPMDYKGTITGPSGRTKKVFELKPYLKDWKAIVGFGGSDFMLARSIANNPRKAVDISVEAIKYLADTVPQKVLKRFGKLLAIEIKTKLENE